MKKKLFFIFIIYVILKPSISFSLVEIDITRGNLDPMPISVSPFFSDKITDDKIKNNLNIENLGLELSKIIENNLEKTGLFDAIEKEAFLQKPDIAHLKPRFEDWALIKSFSTCFSIFFLFSFSTNVFFFFRWLLLSFLFSFYFF